MRFREWFVESHPEVLDRGKCLLEGQEVEFGTLNNIRLREAIREHYREGQEALKGFVRWLVRHEGLTEENAHRNAATVWNTYCLTWNHDEGKAYPERILTNSTYKQGSIALVRTALIRYARYSKDLDLVAKIHGIREAARGSVIEQDENGGPRIYPYTRAEIDSLLAAAEELRDDPRWPWGWPVFRMIVLGGIGIVELVLVSRDQIATALQVGSLVLWRSNRGPRSLPTDLVRKELEVLRDWPWNWSTLSDVIAPMTSRHHRSRAAKSAISRLSKSIYEKAGIEFGVTWISMCRWAAAIRYYGLTKNFIAAAHIVGTRDANKVEWLLETMIKRQREREKGSKRRPRRSIAQEAEAETGGDQ